jgi:hypothetical protein
MQTLKRDVHISQPKEDIPRIHAADQAKLVKEYCRRKAATCLNRQANSPHLSEIMIFLQPRAEAIMQNGSIIRRTRKRHSDIWQFRWWERSAEGRKIYRRKLIGTTDQIPDLEAARKAARLLIPDLNVKRAALETSSMTVAQLCSHFDQRELCLNNTWRSYSTKSIYKVYLKRWVIPKWSDYLLSDVQDHRGRIVAPRSLYR